MGGYLSVHSSYSLVYYLWYLKLCSTAFSYPLQWCRTKQGKQSCVIWLLWISYPEKLGGEGGDAASKRYFAFNTPWLAWMLSKMLIDVHLPLIALMGAKIIQLILGHLTILKTTMHCSVARWGVQLLCLSSPRGYGKYNNLQMNKK